MNKERLEFARQSKRHRPVDWIAKDAKISPTAKIGEDGFGWARDEDNTLVKVQHAGNVVIQSEVEIRDFCTVDRAVKGSTLISQGTKIDHHCHIAHGVKIGKWNTIAAHCDFNGSVTVGDYNTFGTGVHVQPHLKIGSNCIIGSGAVVTKDVPDNSVMVGNPAKQLKR